jgi:hypothetical protein
MYARYVAYGLDLHASFPLPGVAAASGKGLPALALARLTPAELDAQWNPNGRRTAWVGKLGDGQELTIDLGATGDALFSYGDRARFRLDASGERLECAPQLEGLHWQQALLGRILPNVAVMRGYEALHASAVESPAGVVALAAPSGMGKTTLALELMRRGWPLFADDVLTLGEGSDGVLAHPGAPHMNVAEDPYRGMVSERLGTSLGTLAGERWVAVDAIADGPRPVSMVCMLTRAPGLPLEAQVLPASPLPLAPYMLGLADQAEREGPRFERYADLMSGAILVRLTGALEDPPEAFADLVEQTLAGDARMALEGTR